MSSETPADRPSASSKVTDEAQPRRALGPDAQDGIRHGTEPQDGGNEETAEQTNEETNGATSDTPYSPSTPDRFRDRLTAGGRRARPADAEQSASYGRNWSWDLPQAPDPEKPRWAATRAPHATAEDPAGSRTGDPWLTASPPPAAELSQDPTEPLPTVPAPGAMPTGPNPAAGATPADAPEPITEDAVPTDVAAQPQSAPTAEKPGQQQPGQQQPGQQKPGRQPGQNNAAKKPGGKPGGKGALALKGRQRFKVLQSVGPRTPRPDIPDQSHLPVEQRMDLAVRVTNLSITYRTSFEKKPTLRQAVVRFGRGQRAVREIRALQDVSFEVRTGRSVGIIGRNGAGKSTLMRAMAGILPPTSGAVEVWGKASTLLALGVGFNNSLSGRENIILGGLASGLSLNEVEDRANEIAEWTELGDFIDMPMRTYSSGMAARVAFAVAVHMEPDILMIDEGLSTGDAHFKDKASAKMSELRDRARAMFLVSHGLGSIRELCDEAIWIDKGHLMARGEPEEVVDKYLYHLKAGRHSSSFEDV